MLLPKISTMFLVGLTGGIASGKSTVSWMLQELGCPLVDADKVAREVVKPGEPAWHKIREHFGSDVFFDDGQLNREKLGQIIFSDQQKRHLLNSITHPEIYKSMVWKILGHFVRGEHFVVLDLPLLFESGKMLHYLSHIVVVSCDEESQLDRLKARNNYTTEEALQRIQSQMSLAEKVKRATLVINNSGSVRQTGAQVENMYHKFQRSKAHWKLRFVIGLAFTGLVGVTYLLVKLVLNSQL